MNKLSTSIRWTIASALMIATIGSTGIALASDEEHAAALSSPAAPAPAVVNMSTQTQSPVLASCSFTAPCPIERTTDGRLIDTGGPGLLFVASADED